MFPEARMTMTTISSRKKAENRRPRVGRTSKPLWRTTTRYAKSRGSIPNTVQFCNSFPTVDSIRCLVVSSPFADSVGALDYLLNVISWSLINVIYYRRIFRGCILHDLLVSESSISKKGRLWNSEC